MKRVKYKRNIFNVEKLKSWAVSVKKLDSFSCIACGYSRKLHSHHILPKSKYRQYAYNVNNGVTLCILCHIGSNGVHGSGKARNSTVKILRNLMKCDDFSKVEVFISSLKRKNFKIKTVSKKKKSKKFKLFKKFKRRYY